MRRHWARNTIFVIVADHCASGVSRTALQPEKYHIPLLICSPGHLQPQKVDKLMSQIDIPPTILGLLNISYNSKFFGHDIFKTPPEKERAFIGTYQQLGMMTRDSLVILLPGELVLTSSRDNHNSPQPETSPNSRLVQQAIALYEAASYSFDNGLYRHDSN